MAQKRKPKLQELATFTQQLANLLNSGMPLTVALNSMTHLESKGIPSSVSRELKQEVMEGRSLSDAMAKQPKIFSDLFVNMVRAGDQSTKAAVDGINDRGTLLCLQAERGFLRGLQGDCNCPVGVLANIENGMMKMRAQIFLQGRVAPHQGKIEGAPDDRDRLAAELLNRLRAPASAQG